jgi:hypothetical protein
VVTLVVATSGLGLLYLLGGARGWLRLRLLSLLGGGRGRGSRGRGSGCGLGRLGDHWNYWNSGLGGFRNRGVGRLGDLRDGRVSRL